MSTPPPFTETREDTGVEPAHSKPELAVSVAASAVDVLFDSTGEHSQVFMHQQAAALLLSGPVQLQISGLAPVATTCAAK